MKQLKTTHQWLLPLLLLPFAAADAEPWGSTAGGVVVGGAIGGLVAGVPGAAVGVVLGGLTGAGADNEARQEYQEAVRSSEYMDQAEWERHRRKRNQQLADLRQESWDDDNNRQPRIKVASLDPSVPLPSSDMALINDTQRSLIKQGYDPGELGTLNRQTVAEITAYQVRYGLLETGRPSKQLLHHMRQHGG